MPSIQCTLLYLVNCHFGRKDVLPLLWSLRAKLLNIAPSARNLEPRQRKASATHAPLEKGERLLLCNGKAFCITQVLYSAIRLVCARFPFEKPEVLVVEVQAVVSILPTNVVLWLALDVKGCVHGAGLRWLRLNMHFHRHTS